MKAKEVVVVVSGLVNPKITSGARYEHCTFVGVSLNYVTLCNVSFSDCNFSACNFDSTRWVACEWSKCYNDNIFVRLNTFAACTLDWVRGCLDTSSSLVFG